MKEFKVDYTVFDKFTALSVTYDDKRINELLFDSENEAKAFGDELVKRCNSYGVLLETLQEAQLQIEYLHGRFKETGSGNSVLSRIESAISKALGK